MKNNLEQIRKSKNLSQDQLSKLLKVSRQTISSIENGRYNPSILLAFKLSIFFHLPIEEIFIYEEEYYD
ncbi:MAG: helix-turn-helix transcriptional regulator [Tissierellales bacterium]|jgi:putative transcriptional regulator|nr:helix-turn-helix transcriptional regulator [Tissierellales bacterium]